jgi:hypothetical protein
MFIVRHLLFDNRYKKGRLCRRILAPKVTCFRLELAGRNQSSPEHTPFFFRALKGDECAMLE